MSIQKSTIVVLIPCLNEEITIGKVIRDFQKSIPEAQIIVFDNNSTDRTASIAHESGAKVIKELRPGKGHVMANMFQKVEADYYVIVDGDDKFIVESTNKIIPNFLINNDIHPKNEKDIINGFKIVGEFLDKTILKPNNINFPLSRIELGNLIK